MVEKRVRGDLDLMKKDPLAGSAQADRHGVTDEVDFVAARGKLDAKLGSDHTGTAVCWIAGDSDFHDGRLCAVDWIRLRFVDRAYRLRVFEERFLLAVGAATGRFVAVLINVADVLLID
jgi:hypothetical protein